MSGKCIVIGAGDLTVEIESGEEDFVIAVDGGLRYCDIQGLEPDLILGDFDSVNEQEAEKIAELERQTPDRIIRLAREKDDTDMLAALREGLERGFKDFRIYAGTGGQRFEHTLANIQCLLFLKRRGAVGYLMEKDEVTLVISNEKIRFQKSMQRYLSLFSLAEESRGVSIAGMKYTLENAVLTNDYPVGISNEFIGEEASISVEEGSLACILRYGLGQK